MIEGFTARAKGASHKDKGLPCQDCMCVSHILPRKGYIIAVADGHGSEKHFRSDQGARLAVLNACNRIVDFIDMLSEEKKDKSSRFTCKKDFEGQIKQLEKSIILHWREAVLKHYRDNPLNETEKEICARLKIDETDENNQVRFYGTTLLAAWLQKTFWFILQIGDGEAVIIDEQKKACFPPELKDETLGFGMTTSLCQRDACDHFRRIYGFSPIKGITLASDGVTDSFIPDAYLKFHEHFYDDFCENSQKAKDDIKKYIDVWQQTGPRDDATIAGIFVIEEKADVGKSNTV